MTSRIWLPEELKNVEDASSNPALAAQEEQSTYETTTQHDTATICHPERCEELSTNVLKGAESKDLCISLKKWYYVYIMTNRSKTLYTGITGKLHVRVIQHKTGAFEGFTSKYKLDRLVYWERYTSVHRAIAREKQIKGWRRIKKIQLIVSMNPTWADLAADWHVRTNA